MNNSFLVFETDKHHSKQTAKLMAVCSSKRQAVTLGVNCLLITGAIGTADIGEAREQLHDNSKTNSFKNNVLIEEIEQNKLIEDEKG